MTGAIVIDETSLLVEVAGDATLGDVEAALATRTLTLGFVLGPEARAATVADWLGDGAPGAPSVLHDPADQLLSGVHFTLADGSRVALAPSPRKAVGPDLRALVVGARGRFAEVTRAWLRVHRVVERRPMAPLPDVDLEPALSDGERAMLERIAAELPRR